MQRIRQILLGLVMVLGVTVVTPALVSADNAGDACTAIGSGASCYTPAGSPDIVTIVTAVINVLSWVVGIVAVIMIIVGGLRYVTSGGDSNKTAGAKNTLLYAIIGLVVVALAQSIVFFVLQKATGIPDAKPAPAKTVTCKPTAAKKCPA